MYSDISDALKRERIQIFQSLKGGMYSEISESLKDHASFSESIKGNGGSRPEPKTCQNLSFLEYRT